MQKALRADAHALKSKNGNTRKKNPALLRTNCTQNSTQGQQVSLQLRLFYETFYSQVIEQEALMQPKPRPVDVSRLTPYTVKFLFITSYGFLSFPGMRKDGAHLAHWPPSYCILEFEINLRMLLDIA
jgi:hypothetical protein